MNERPFRRPSLTARHAFELFNTNARPTADTLLEDVRVRTGKAVVFETVPELAGTGMTGLWFERRRHHVILEPPPVSPFHRRFVRLHEIGHIAFAWLGLSAPPAHAGQNLLRMSASTLREVAQSHRTSLSSPNEQAVEYFACHADSAERKSQRNGLALLRRHLW